MSYEAVSWAMAQNVGKSSTKFVLVAMAEHVFQSTPAIADGRTLRT